MTEAIFAGEEIKEFSLRQRPALFTLRPAPISRLGENFLKNDRARNARDGNREDE
jgi:hypothetical protein